MHNRELNPKQMEACYRRSTQNRACFCVKCRQGVLSKVQYTDQIRALCSQIGKSRSKSDSFVPTLRTSPRRATVSASVQFEKNVTPREKVIGNSGFTVFQPEKYYIDEEQPKDLISYNIMVNGTTGDPRILPAIVDTLKHLRSLYHHMVTKAKCDSSLSVNREFNNFRLKECDTCSSYEQSSDETATGKPQYFDFGSAQGIQPAEKGVKNYSDVIYVAPLTELKKRQKSIEVEKVALEADNKDCDSGIHFDCDAFESRSNYSSRLHEAAKEGDVEKMMRLILDICDVNGLDGDGWPAIESALSKSKFRAALFLIEAGTDMSRYTKEKVDEYGEIISKARSYTHFIRTAV